MTNSARNVPTQTRHESRQHRPRDPEHRGPAVRQVTARPEGDRGARVHLSRVLRARPWELMLGGPCPGAPQTPSLPRLRSFRPGSASRHRGGPIPRRRFAGSSRRSRSSSRPASPPGKALISADEMVGKLRMAKAVAADLGRPDFVVIARTDAVSAVDAPEPTRGLDLAIDRALRYLESGAPDLVWAEFPNADRGPTERFAEEVHRRFPDAPLAFNWSRSFKWFNEADPTGFRELGALGYRFIFVTLTYRDLDERTDRLAAALARRGVTQGDRVTLFMPNSLEFVVAFYGALKAGGVVNPINALSKEREVRFQVADAGATAVLYHESLASIVDAVRGY